MNEQIPTTPQWRFRQMHAGELNIDPIEAEFFSTETLGSLSDAFSREVIQNSLDARLPGATLKIRILFSSTLALAPDQHQSHYITGLMAHLGASSTTLTKLPAADEPFTYMVVEDFGTRGLQGDPAQSEDEEIGSAAPRNDFYYFWRNVGRSRKQDSELGRWGLGKTVFPAASRINSFFGLTVRADDSRRLLMGQSVLKIHKLGGKRFYPYGYFGRFDGDFAIPVNDRALVEQFCSNFQISRGDEPGLSAVVPYPDAELTVETMVPSIVRHYFLPIIAGDLVVELVHDGKTTLLNALALPKLLAQASWEDAQRLQRLVELAQWGLSLPLTQYVQLAAPSETNAPRWNENCMSADVVVQLKEQLNSGQKIAVSVPVWVKPAADRLVLARFNVYLERDEALDSADEHFVRDGITISGVRTAMPKGIRAFITIHDPALSKMLGDSENPAHTEWQERSRKFKDKYRHGPYTLRYVKNAPREIVRILTRPSEGRDFKLLQHLFSVHVPTEEAVMDPKKGHEDKPGAAATAAPDAMETVGSDRFFQLQKLRGGFRLAGMREACAMPQYAAIWIAYEVRRGNPFSQYQPPDFEVNKPPIKLHAEQAEVTRQSGNFLVLRIQQSDFTVTVKGFDPRRDIRVKVLGLDEDTGT